MKLTRATKDILIAMIKKAKDADVVKAEKSQSTLPANHPLQKRRQAVIALIAKDPAKCFNISDYEISGHLYPDFHSTDWFISEFNKIAKKFPFDEKVEDSVEFPALGHTLYDVPFAVISKYRALSEQIDAAVMSGDSKKLYDMVKATLT